MNYKVRTISLFDKQAKRLTKKYRSLKIDLNRLIQDLEENPKQGSPLGNNFYKVRLQITSKGKGKSGGARVITYIKVIANTIYLSYIYDKGERDNITDSELQDIFKEIP